MSRRHHQLLLVRCVNLGSNHALVLAWIEHSREGSIQRVVSRDLDRRREVEATEADRDGRARGRVDVLLALKYRREQSVNDAR